MSSPPLFLSHSPPYNYIFVLNLSLFFVVVAWTGLDIFWHFLLHCFVLFYDILCTTTWFIFLSIFPSSPFPNPSTFLYHLCVKACHSSFKVLIFKHFVFVLCLVLSCVSFFFGPQHTDRQWLCVLDRFCLMVPPFCNASLPYCHVIVVHALLLCYHLAVERVYSSNE